jgi:hypothetical protein
VNEDQLERLRRRVKQVRANALVRRWEHRQRDHAKGVWFRLRLLLSDAESAWRISEQDARQLISEGARPEPVGDQLEPPRLIVFVPEQRLSQLPSRQALAVRLEAELLQSRFLALVRFPAASG